MTVDYFGRKNNVGAQFSELFWNWEAQVTKEVNLITPLSLQRWFSTLVVGYGFQEELIKYQCQILQRPAYKIST